jgi:hypothetical protein
METQLTMAPAKSHLQCHDKEAIGTRLGCSPRLADELMKTGKIRCFRVGRKRVATEAALSDFIRQQERVHK